MTYQTWRQWVFDLPWKYKWFIILILLRPLANLAYEKELLFSFTLLDFIGLLTPMIILSLAFLRKLPSIRHAHSQVSGLFIIWSFLLVFNAILIVFPEFSLERLSIAVKITLPVYLFLFLRHFIQRKEHLEGLLLTILYSAIIPAFLLFYEILVKPFDIGHSRGLERIRGGYADVLSYSGYILFSMLICGYLWISQLNPGSEKRIRSYQFISVMVVCFIGLTFINHSATYITFLSLFCFFIYSDFRQQKYKFRSGNTKALAVILILTIFGIIFFQTQIKDKLSHLTQTDMMVLSGERDTYSAFHGRMERWTRLMRSFREDSLLHEQMFGFIGMTKPYMLTSGPHNDYLRILFATGYFGLIIYLAILFFVFKRSKKFISSERFICRGVLLILVLMSVSTTPTFYISTNYLFISILAYIVLPKSAKRDTDV